MAFFRWLEQVGVTLHPGGWSATERLLAHLQLRSGELVADLGCGVGRTLAYAVRRYRVRAVGVDLMSSLAARACRQVLSAKSDSGFGMAADIMHLPFQDAVFDAAWAESVFVFLPKPDAFAEVARILKPNGRLGMIELAWRDKSFPEYCEQTRQFLQVPCYQVLSLQEWSAMLRAAGFTLRVVEKLPSHALPSPLPQRLSDWWDMVRLGFGLSLQVPLRQWWEGAIKVVNLFRHTRPAIFVAVKGD